MKAATGKKQSELIREAVDRLLDSVSGDWRDAVLRETAGLWSDRTDMPDLATERRSWDRG